MKIQPLNRTKLPSAVVDQIRGQILLGELVPGEEIPSERELAEGFGVNRTTVREALMELTHVGLISRKQGRRCVVLDYLDSGSPELLVHLLRLPIDSRVRNEVASSFFVSLESMYDIAVDFIKRDGQSLDEVRATVETMELGIAQHDVDAVFASDRAFHRAFFRCTGSIVFQLMILPLYRAIDEGLDLGGSYGRRAAMEYVRRRSSGERLPPRAILDALESGDFDRAKQVISKTVRVMRKVYKKHAR